MAGTIQTMSPAAFLSSFQSGVGSQGASWQKIAALCNAAINCAKGGGLDAGAHNERGHVMNTFKIGARLLVSLLGVLAAMSAAEPAPQNAQKSDAAKIASAMSAAPAPVSRNASVVEMAEDGSMKTLRKGTNEWTCVPDDPSTPGDDPMCLDPNAMEWLHAYMGKSPPPEKVTLEV